MYKTFIIHSSDLSDREKKVEELKQFFNDTSVVSKYTTNDVTDANLAAIKIEPVNKPAYDTGVIRMTKPEYSICLNHIAAFEEAIASGYTGPVLFIEDDCMFNGNVIEKITGDIELFLESDYDLMYMNVGGNNTGKLAAVDLETTIIPVSNAYMIKSSALEKILKFLKQQIKYTFPRLLAYAAMMAECKACICTDQHIIDGSKYGAFLSIVSDNSILPINPMWSQIYNYISKNPGKCNPEIEKHLDDLSANSHPAMFILKGMYASECKGEHQAAKKIYEDVNSSFIQKGITMNGSRMFMKKYAELYKNLQ